MITRTPETLEKFEATDIYYRMLEESIQHQPELWLWSHNRWKRTREEYNLRYDPATGRVDLGPIEEIMRKANKDCHE